MSRAEHSKSDPLDPEPDNREALDAAKRHIEKLILDLPLREAGEILLAATDAMLAKTNNYSPGGSRLMRLESNKKGDSPEHISITFGRGTPAGMLSTAYDAVKKALGV